MPLRRDEHALGAIEHFRLLVDALRLHLAQPRGVNISSAPWWPRPYSSLSFSQCSSQDCVFLKSFLTHIVCVFLNISHLAFTASCARSCCSPSYGCRPACRSSSTASTMQALCRAYPIPRARAQACVLAASNMSWHILSKGKYCSFPSWTILIGLLSSYLP